METNEIVEGWLRFQGLTMAQLKRDDRRAHLALARRQIMEYLRGQGWTYRKIGNFLDRDAVTVWNGLTGKPHVPWNRHPKRAISPEGRNDRAGHRGAEAVA